MDSIEWELWYQDTFDRETPRRVEATGRGLEAGLRALWVYHLLEGVRPDGRPTFARFNLWLPAQGRSITVTGDREGVAHLRGWVAGAPDSRSALLRQMAKVHTQLLQGGQDSAPLLTAARYAASRAAFVAWLTGDEPDGEG